MLCALKVQESRKIADRELQRQQQKVIQKVFLNVNVTKYLSRDTLDLEYLSS